MISRSLKNSEVPTIRKAVKQTILLLGEYLNIGKTIEKALEIVNSDDRSKL